MLIFHIGRADGGIFLSENPRLRTKVKVRTGRACSADVFALRYGEDVTVHRNVER